MSRKLFRRFGFTLTVSGRQNLLSMQFSKERMLITNKELLALNLNLLLIRSLTQHQKGRTYLKLRLRNLNRQTTLPNLTKRKDETTQLLDNYLTLGVRARVRACDIFWLGGLYWKKDFTRGLEYGPTIQFEN